MRAGDRSRQIWIKCSRIDTVVGRKKNTIITKLQEPKRPQTTLLDPDTPNRNKESKMDLMRLLPIPLRVACQIGLATLPQNRQVPLLLFCYHGSLQMYLLHVKNEMLYQGLPSAPRIIQLRNRISGLGAETGQILHAPRSTLHEKHQSGRGASKGERYSRYMSCSELYPTRKST